MSEDIYNISLSEDYEMFPEAELQNKSRTFFNIPRDQTFNISDCVFNDTCENTSASRYPVDLNKTQVWLVAISFALSILILATILGNVFVIAAVMFEKNIKTVGNYLVLSLAMTDLLVACLVMPLGAIYEVSQEWTLGPLLCDFWISCDVLCCTASILHLLAIATDGYWAVTNVNYIYQRSMRHIGFMIFIVWFVALLVSIAPFFGWKDPEFEERIRVYKVCLISQDLSYQVFATCASFYLPLVIVLILYWRIYKEARERIRRKPGNASYRAHRRLVVPRGAQSVVEVTTTFAMCSSSNTSSGMNTNTLQNRPISQRLSSKEPSKTTLLTSKKLKNTAKENTDLKRERKAARTLAVITSVFVACWLPFFIIALMMPVCHSCDISQLLFSVFLWLGYANSLLNPIIYTVFSPDFRCAFKRLVWRCFR